MSEPSFNPPPNTWTNPPSPNSSTARYVLGGAAFGTGVRIWQLGILQRPLLSNPGTHLLSAASFAFVGYWLWRWDIRSTELLEEKKNQIAARQGYIRGLSSSSA